MDKFLILLHILVFVLKSVDGSMIQLQTSHAILKPLLTTNMTLRCSLRDSSPSSQVIGKRSVDDVTSIKDQRVDDLDISTNEGQADVNNKTPTKRSAVTHTDENMTFALSIVISRDGVDLARINEHFPATVAPGLSGFEVFGQVNQGGNSGEMGYLELHWSHPTLAEAGNYNCAISALSLSGHDVDFGQSLEVNAEDLTIDDLAKSVHGLIISNEIKDETIANLTGELNALKAIARTEPDVFFESALSGSKNFNSDQTIVYDIVHTNQGSGYDNKTGVFTAPVSGFYTFDIHVNCSPSEARVTLRVNGEDKVESGCWASLHDYNTASNSLTTYLAKGDKVNAASRHGTTAYLYKETYPTNTFSGQLLSIN